MAKKSVIARNERRRRKVAHYQARRQELLKLVSNRNLPPEDMFALRQELHLLPRDSAANRLSNRCKITGRKRAYYRKFGLSRLMVRDLASQGRLPGVKKASW